MENKLDFRGNYIEIKSSLIENDIDLLLKAPKSIVWLQFYNFAPNESDLKIINDFFKKRPEIFLRSVKPNQLKFLSNVENVWFNTFPEEDFNQLNYLNNLKGVNLGRLNSKIDICPLLQYKDTLTHLAFENDITKKSTNVINDLSMLKSVQFISSKFESFDFLSGLSIEEFKYFGSRTKNYDVLNTLQTLKYFWLKTNTNWEDFSFIENLKNLESIELWYCSGIKKFPKCSHLKNLRLIIANMCNNLEDISELKKLTNCEIQASGSILNNKNEDLYIEL